jgi:NADPH:quinone reductase-like Zn-dependent oxidoreductase
MKAILLYETGGVDKLIYQHIDKPILKEGEILVKVKAIGINPVDAGVRRMEQLRQFIMGDKSPVIIGWDVSGEVVEKSANTDGFNIGDAVFGLLPNGDGGAYAEYVAVPASVMAHKPDNISHEEAAAVPIAGITAWQPLNLMNIKKGDRVLIPGGAGGVGHYAVQIAKHLGAYVISSSSAKNREFVLSLGADEHIDYTQQNVYDVVKDIDAILYSTRDNTLDQAIDVVKKGGIIISIVPPLTEAQQQKAQEKEIHLSQLFGQVNGDDMRALAELLKSGVIKSHVSATYPFEEMGAAHTAVETGRTVGKIVVTL